MQCSCLIVLWCGLVVGQSGPNFVIVLTDDQDLVLNGLAPMSRTLDMVANAGVTFQNAFVNSPICCPSRSTILTGKYLHNTGVVNNSISGNCSSSEWQANHEIKSFVNIMKQERNYKTFYAGKYLNQYGSKEAGGPQHVPEGYDWWMCLQGNSKYYDYELSINGTSTEFTEQYLTDVIQKYALDFLNQKHVRDDPFVMFLAPPAAHAPFTPAPRHENKFPDVKALRTPAFNYTPIGKHWLLQLPPLHLPENVTILDDMQRHRQQTLLAVDEMIETVLQKLSKLKILDRTYIIFTSDNGFHIGQFGMPWDKRQPYDTDVRVPLLIRGPQVMKKVLVKYPVSSVDLAPTILDLAGIKIPIDMDGSSFKDKLVNVSNENDRLVLIQYVGEGNSGTVDVSCNYKDSDQLSECGQNNWCKCQDARNNTYNCLIRIGDKDNLKFCQFFDRQFSRELYDLVRDPYELNNLHLQNLKDVDSYIKILRRFVKCSGKDCAKIANELHL